MSEISRVLCEAGISFILIDLYSPNYYKSVFKRVNFSRGVKLKGMNKTTRNLSQDNGVPVDVLNGITLLKVSRIRRYKVKLKCPCCRPYCVPVAGLIVSLLQALLCPRSWVEV